eukprot:3213443-Prymnesium_polylepis.1
MAAAVTPTDRRSVVMLALVMLIAPDYKRSEPSKSRWGDVDWNHMVPALQQDTGRRGGGRGLVFTSLRSSLRLHLVWLFLTRVRLSRVSASDVT